jgi:hypothetical protein
MINYKWTCESLNCYAEKDGKKNVAYSVNFKVVGTYFEFENGLPKVNETPYIIERMDSFDLPELKQSDDFSEFETLTSEEVIGWVKSGIGESGIKKIEANISESIEILKRPIIQKVNLKLK